MDNTGFADFYERYRAQCARAGLAPLAREDALQVLATLHPTKPFSGFAGDGGAANQVAAPLAND